MNHIATWLLVLRQRMSAKHYATFRWVRYDNPAVVPYAGHDIKLDSTFYVHSELKWDVDVDCGTSSCCDGVTPRR